MSALEAFILGIIQGLTEFLPVSSSGHIELGKAILNVHPADPLLFSVVVHAATALSTLVVFRKDIFDIFSGLAQGNKTSIRFSVFILVSMIPAAFIGLFFNDVIETLFEENVVLVGSMLLLTGVLLLLTDFTKTKEKKLNLFNVIMIGIAQAIAILPGISRSGATISTSVILGISRSEAARFSFLMVVPLILGKMAKDLLDSKMILESDAILPMILGFSSAFVTGLLACTLMIRVVKKSKLWYFSIYCFVVGISALIISII